MRALVRKIIVVLYDENWPELFTPEKERLTEILGDQALSIHHIGSTAIPNTKAKPIIDILVEVKNIEMIDEFNDRMIQEGYRPRGENGIPGRRYFVKSKGVIRTHHLHMFQIGNPEIERHLSFRDYLIAHPEEAQTYSNLKEELARKYPEDSLSYMTGKDEFIKKIDKKAKAWKKQVAA